MLKTFIPRIKFVHVDRLITQLVEIVAKAQSVDGIFVCNINPFMVATAILYISH